MNKAKFFALLANSLKFHNDGSNRYTAADFQPYEFHENPENFAKWKAENPDYPWVAHSSGYKLKECWLVCVISHRTAEAATKQTAIFARWIAEYKAK